MDTLKPRLRILRRSPSPHPSSETTPGARSRFPTVHDDEDEFPTPRIQPKPIASPNGDPTPKPFPSASLAPTETPAARLRALLAREPRTLNSTTPNPPPSPPSEANSTTGPPLLGSSTSSVTRASLKDIFSRALREPGDTPQKGRPRRNSLDSSSMEITPVVNRDRGRRRVSRKSLSDEEAEKPKSTRRSDPSFRLSTAVAFDNLRARLVSSQSQLMDENLSDALYGQSSLASTSTSGTQHRVQPSTSSSQFHPTRQTSLVTTTHPSFQMSANLASQSNLLEQDSEMQRAMGDVLNSESEASTSAPNAVRPTPMTFDPRPSFLAGRKSSPGLELHHTNHELDSSFVNERTEEDGRHRSQDEERSLQRERESNHPKLPLGSNVPEARRRHSQEFSLRRLSQDFRSHSHTKSLPYESNMPQGSAAGPIHTSRERRGSLVSLRSFDDDFSSRPSSIGSQADYRDRMSELEREKNHEREREWNKRQPPSRPSSSLSTSSNNSFSHSHSHPPRSPSAIPYLTPTHASLHRKTSRTSFRSDSPASLASSHDSLKELEQEEKKEVAYERERNWNSPRPHWSTSRSPSSSHFGTRGKDNSSLRPTTSATRLEGSNEHQDSPRVPAKQQSASPKTTISSVMPPASSYKSDDHSGPSTDENTTDSVRQPLANGFSPDRTPGTASRFGWNFARNPLPPLELDDPVDRRKSTSTPIPRPSSRASEAITSSQIPVRSRMKSFSSVSHANSDMSLTHVVGDESSIQQGQTEVVNSRSRGEFPVAGSLQSQEGIVLASDEEPIIDLPQSTTPKSNPRNLISVDIDTDTETEVLSSPSSKGSPRLGTPAFISNETPRYEVNGPTRSQTSNISPKELSVSATPPGTPPSANPKDSLSVSEMSPSFSLITPPRHTSLVSSIADFRTPSPPQDLPDLPGPPSSSDDDALGSTPIKGRADVNSNLTLSKTPKPPGAWTATPLPPKFNRRSPSPATLFPLESTPPSFTSTPLPRVNTHPHSRAEADGTDEDQPLTPVGVLPRARSLPLRTPAPPGAWMATPGQSVLISSGVDQSQYGSLGRKKGPLKVRFDVAESEASATEGHSNSPLSAIRLANPELPLPRLSTDRGTDMRTEVMSTISSERPTTPTSRDTGPSSRSLRKSPTVRLVDAYGRERVDEEVNARTIVDLSNGHADAERKTTTPPTTPRRSLVRIVDAMGREIDDTAEISHAPKDRTNMSFEADVSVVSDDGPVGRAEALGRMRNVLKDLAEGLSDADRSDDFELDSSHLDQLEEVSQAARLARNQLAHNLHLEEAKHHDLQHKNRFSTWTRGLLPTASRKPWNTAIIYCGIIIQLLLVLAMWRYAHAEARHLFYTTYYDPIYPEFTPIQGSSCFSGTLLTTRSWTLFDSYETIQREGWWSIRQEILRAMRHFGNQAWERWGEHARFEKPT